VGQSFGTLLSSFSKQPLAGTSPPSNLVWALVTQSLAFGSPGLPGVSARASHLSNPAAFFAMQAVLPARHFACWADEGAAGKSRSVTSAVPIELLVMSPSDVQRSKRWKMASTRNDEAHHWMVVSTDLDDSCVTEGRPAGRSSIGGRDG
jgi:hypothetical protein